MAIVYVDSNAAGANNGTSWTDAYTSFNNAGVDGAAAGDEIWVEDSHSETFPTGTAITLDFLNATHANPIKILCIDSSDDSLSTGAVIHHAGVGTSDNINISASDGSLIFHEIDFEAYQLELSISASDEDFIWFVGGRLALNRTTGGPTIDLGGTNDESRFYFDKTHIDMSPSANVNAIINIANQSYMRFRNCTWTKATSQETWFMTGNRRCRLEIEGSDLSTAFASLTTAVIEGMDGGNSFITVKYCNIPSSITWSDATIQPAGDGEILIQYCDNGTITVPALGLQYHETGRGTIASSLSKYRTGGANDGEQANAYSWEAISNANPIEIYDTLESRPLPVWVDGGSEVTLTVYLAGGATLNDDDFWIDIVSPNETASPNQTAEGNFFTSRMDPRSTPTALTTDGDSTWTGTGVGTKQKISRTFTPTEAGLVVVRLQLAKPSTTVYVDPRIEIV